MTGSRLSGLIAHLPDGITEIYTHPATASDFAGAAPGYRYRGGTGRADLARSSPSDR